MTKGQVRLLGVSILFAGNTASRMGVPVLQSALSLSPDGIAPMIAEGLRMLGLCGLGLVVVPSFFADEADEAHGSDDDLPPPKLLPDL
jgi:hypothetical protein